MEIRHLRYFVAVAECGGFVRAADQLHVTQSALSRQVRDLEEELKVPLFDRSKRAVSLTYPGECFLDSVRKLLADLERAQILARAAQAGKVGALTIGLVGPFSWHAAVTKPIREFRQQNPEVALTAVIMNTAEQLAALRERRISAGFLLNTPPGEKDLEIIPVLHDRLMLAVPDSSRFARRPPKRLAELADENLFWIARRIEPLQYDQLLKAFTESGVTPRIAGEGISDTANLSLVAAGLGCTFVTAETKWRKPENVVLVPVRDLQIDVSLEFVWRRENRQPALDNFVSVLATHPYARPAAGTRRRAPERKGFPRRVNGTVSDVSQ